MKVRWQPSFEIQRQRYAFCFTCEDCRYFDNRQKVCAHGYPDAVHRSARYSPADPPLEIVFCKEFELG